MNIYGIGCDIVSISRIGQLYQKYGIKILKRILTKNELVTMVSKNMIDTIDSQYSSKTHPVKQHLSKFACNDSSATSLLQFVIKATSKLQNNFINDVDNQKTKRVIAYLAKRYAAKQAYAKAMGTGISNNVNFQSLEIINDAKGAPKIFLINKKKDWDIKGSIINSCNAISCNDINTIKVISIDKFGSSTKQSVKIKPHISISDEKEYALAYVILEQMD